MIHLLWMGSESYSFWSGLGSLFGGGGGRCCFIGDVASLIFFSTQHTCFWSVRTWASLSLRPLKNAAMPKDLPSAHLHSLSLLRPSELTYPQWAHLPHGSGVTFRVTIHKSFWSWPVLGLLIYLYGYWKNVSSQIFSLPLNSIQSLNHCFPSYLPFQVSNLVSFF